MTTKIPLPAGLKSIPELPKLREAVVNQIRLGDSLIPRPGLIEDASGYGACRAAVTVGGLPHFVMGNRMYRRTNDGTMTDLGQFSGTSRVRYDVGLAGAVLVDTNGGAGYVLSESGYTQISSPYFEPSKDVAYIDGYYVTIPIDGGPAQFSAVIDPSDWPAANFFDAELLPDLNVGCRNWRGDLYMMGEEVTEVYRTSGNPSAPFVRASGAAIPVGLVAAHIEYGGTFVFIGKRKEHSFGIYAMGAGDADKISNDYVDYLLNNEYTLEEMQSAYANRFVWRGVDVVTFHLPRHTLAFYGAWAVFESGIDEEIQEPWKAAAIIFVGDEYFAGTTDGAIATLGGYSDLGLPYAMGFDTFARTERGTYFRLSNLELDCLTGSTSTDYRVGLQLSDDARIWSQRFWRNLGGTGKFRQRVMWDMPGGLGTYESYAGIRVRTTDPVTFALDGMKAVIV